MLVKFVSLWAGMLAITVLIIEEMADFCKLTIDDWHIY